MAATARSRPSAGCNGVLFLMLAVALSTLGPVRTSNPLSPAAPAADCAGKGKAGGNCSGKLQDRRAGSWAGSGGLDGPQALLLPTPSILPFWLPSSSFALLTARGGFFVFFFRLGRPSRHATWAGRAFLVLVRPPLPFHAE